MERACPALPAPLTPPLPLRVQVPGKEAAVPPMEAIKIALDTASAKFTETVEVRRLQLLFLLPSTCLHDGRGSCLLFVAAHHAQRCMAGFVCSHAAVLHPCRVRPWKVAQEPRGLAQAQWCRLCTVSLHAACTAQQPGVMVMLPAACVSIAMPSCSCSPLHDINCHTPLCPPIGARQAEH